MVSAANVNNCPLSGVFLGVVWCIAWCGAVYLHEIVCLACMSHYCVHELQFSGSVSEWSQQSEAASHL